VESWDGIHSVKSTAILAFLALYAKATQKDCSRTQVDHDCRNTKSDIVAAATPNTHPACPTPRSSETDPVAGGWDGSA
jgi:hypothetical protein